MALEQLEKLYCVDTSALLFIADAYPADAFPEVWTTLAALTERGDLVAAREVRRELESKDDNGAYSWAIDNRSLFQPLDRNQIALAREIVNSDDFSGLVDFDSELPDAVPFTVALAISLTHEQTSFLRVPPAVVAVSSPIRPVGLAEVCESFVGRVRFLSPYQMLREVNLDVPEPGGRGLADLYGIWRDLDITAQDAIDAKLKFGPDRL